MASRGRAPDKRDRILQAAIHVFAEKGFFVARVADVAREAGVADGTIYLYFKSKEALLQGLFEESMDRVLVWMRELAASPEPPSERLLAIFERYAQFTEDEPRLAEVLTVQLRESGKLMAEIASQKFGEFLQILTAIIEDGQRRGHFRADLRARTVARVMYGALDELSLSWVMSDARWALSAATREVLDVFLHGIVAGRPQPGAATTATPSIAEPPEAGDTKGEEAEPPPAPSPAASAQGRRISRSNA